jgi:hypothetical protein
MNKILLKIIILMTALILFSSNTEANATILLEVDHPHTSSSAITSSISISEPKNSAPRQLSAMTIADLTPTLPTGHPPASLDLSESVLSINQSLGRLDSINWNTLEDHSYDAVLSSALVFSTSNEYWAHYFVPYEDHSLVNSNENPELSLSQKANLAYALYLSNKDNATTSLGCFACHDPSKSLPLSTGISGNQQLVQSQNNPLREVLCPQCHGLQPAQVNLLIRGVE